METAAYKVAGTAEGERRSQRLTGSLGRGGSAVGVGDWGGWERHPMRRDGFTEMIWSHPVMGIERVAGMPRELHSKLTIRAIPNLSDFAESLPSKAVHILRGLAEKGR
jgi:hypothetical protein